MGDLGLPRDLIKSSASGHTIDLDILYRQFNFDTLFGCVLARATSPCAAESVARAFRFLVERSSNSCASVAPDLDEFTRRYSRRPHSSLQIDVRPLAFDPPQGNGQGVLTREIAHLVWNRSLPV